MMMCLGVFLFGSNFSGILWASWTSWKSISFARFGNFSFIVCSNKFSISCCCSSTGTSIIWILECFRLSQRFTRLSSLFWILVSSFCSPWMFIFYFCSKPLLWVLVSFLSWLVPWIFFFISSWVSLGLAETFTEGIKPFVRQSLVLPSVFLGLLPVLLEWVKSTISEHKWVKPGDDSVCIKEAGFKVLTSFYCYFGIVEEKSLIFGQSISC